MGLGVLWNADLSGRYMQDRNGYQYTFFGYVARHEHVRSTARLAVLELAAQQGTFYARYMDDFVLLTRTRWQLRRCVKRLHEFFNLGGFETHPDKTQLGRIEQGFDWLGVWFTPEGTTIAPRALENHRIKRLRLYEQARRLGLSVADADSRVQAYEARWTIWANGLITDSPFEPH